jgi:hypothetical protein
MRTGLWLLYVAVRSIPIGLRSRFCKGGEEASRRTQRGDKGHFCTTRIGGLLV